MIIINRRQLKKKISKETKGTEYKCVLSDDVIRTICNADKADQEALIRAIISVAEDPQKGDRMDIKKIRARKNETCDCGEKMEIWLDRNSDEVYFTCKKNKCEGFWMTRKEFEEGRKRHGKKKHARKVRH